MLYFGRVFSYFYNYRFNISIETASILYIIILLFLFQLSTVDLLKLTLPKLKRSLMRQTSTVSFFYVPSTKIWLSKII